VAHIRYRCAACGNRTRFDVVTDRRTRAFHHFSVGGELTVEDEQVLSESVVEVGCRWCGHGRSIEVVDDEVADGEVADGEVGDAEVADAEVADAADVTPRCDPVVGIEGGA